MAYERAGLSHERAAVWARRKLDKGLGEGCMNQERNGMDQERAGMIQERASMDQDRGCNL